MRHTLMVRLAYLDSAKAPRHPARRSACSPRQRSDLTVSVGGLQRSVSRDSVPSKADESVPPALLAGPLWERGTSTQGGTFCFGPSRGCQQCPRSHSVSMGGPQRKVNNAWGTAPSDPDELVPQVDATCAAGKPFPGKGHVDPTRQAFGLQAHCALAEQRITPKESLHTPLVVGANAELDLPTVSEEGPPAH